MRMRVAARTLGAVTVLAGLVAGVGYAAGVDPFVSAGPIHACVNAHGGVTIEDPIGPGQACVAPEKPLAWNLQGPTGPKGKKGKTGPTGPTGPPGASPSGLAAYGSFSNDSGLGVGATLGGTSIGLSTTTASLNVSYTGTTATIANAGVYSLGYCVRTTSTLSMSSRLLVNGAGVTSSAISPPQGSDKFCRTTVLSLAAGTTVDLQLYANPPVLATLQSPGGAEMIIEELGPLVP